VACHWNDDPTDNRLDNLRWNTRKNNWIDFEFTSRKRLVVAASPEDRKLFELVEWLGILEG
jgi:hypothetical protein